MKSDATAMKSYTSNVTRYLINAKPEKDFLGCFQLYSLQYYGISIEIKKEFFEWRHNVRCILPFKKIWEQFCVISSPAANPLQKYATCPHLIEASSTKFTLNFFDEQFHRMASELCTALYVECQKCPWRDICIKFCY